MLKRGILVHGGVGSPSEHADGARRAAERGMAVLRDGGSALEAVEEAAAVLEDDGRFNAGSGASLRMDGRTIERDAALMTSDRRLGAVACVSGVKNPIRLARRILDTPHHMLAGDGALEFARLHGLAEDAPPSADALAKHRAFVEKLRNGGLGREWTDFDVRANWNFAVPLDEILSCDTIGAVALDEGGTLAAANSTGGASPMLRGRVGDSPILGCGFYAGPAAAVVTTGWGEKIIDRELARRVYDEISHGETVERAVARGVALYEADVPIGVLAISRRGHHTAHNRDMAAWALVEEAP